MRTLIMVVLTSGMALAQQAASADQIIEHNRQVLRDLQAQEQAEQAALARRQALLAQLEALKSEENVTQLKLDELRTRYSDSHPEVVASKAKLDQLRSQDATLTQRLRSIPDAPVSLKQSSGLQSGPPDRWWKNPATAQSLGLTADQQKKMDDVFQQYRLKLIDLNAALEKEEVTLEPLVAAEPLDEAKTTAQIDRVAQARAELEKANGRMLLGIRKQLTSGQWNKLSQPSSAAQPAKK